MKVTSPEVALAITLAAEAPIEARILARWLPTLRERGRMDMAFGGRVQPGGAAMEITELCGAQTRSANNLVVRSGAGLGGKALALGRPVSVTNYLGAQGITHVYDYAVQPEALETIAALPVVVDGVPRVLIYLGTRAQVGLGDRWFESFTPLLRRMERDIAVDDEVRRRLALMRPSAVSEPSQPTFSRTDLADIAQELADLASNLDDEMLRAKVEALRSRFTPRVASTQADSVPPTLLRPREIDVLQEVARGLSNRDIAETLGLLPNTVKSYLKTAMRKLHADNRMQAILTARQQGLIG